MKINYKEICELITNAYLCKEPIFDEIEKDWKSYKRQIAHKTPEEIFHCAHCLGQDTGLYRIIERINLLTEGNDND